MGKDNGNVDEFVQANNQADQKNLIMDEDDTEKQFSDIETIFNQRRESTEYHKENENSSADGVLLTTLDKRKCNSDSNVDSDKNNVLDFHDEVKVDELNSE